MFYNAVLICLFGCGMLTCVIVLLVGWCWFLGCLVWFVAFSCVGLAG